MKRRSVPRRRPATHRKVSISLDQLPLRPSTLLRCKRSGFVTAAEIEESKAAGGFSTLAAELGCTPKEALSIYREINDHNDQGIKSNPAPTVAELLLRMEEPRHIISFSREIDTMMHGGFPLGELTEVCGLPGSGKTILATQLAVNAALPEEAGGVDGGVVYIDTEGSFSAARTYTLAAALVSHVDHMLKKQHGEREKGWDTSPEDILANIHVFRVCSLAELLTVLRHLPCFLDERTTAGKRVRLVVIDSIAFPFRVVPGWNSNRTRHMVCTAATLLEIAQERQIAVVVTNQMTTKLYGKVPALGSSWAHAITNRLILHNDEGQNRKCQLVKSPRYPSGEAPFLVMEIGVRGLSFANKKPRIV